MSPSKNNMYEKGHNAVNNILDCAENLLVEKGYQHMSLRNIAATANISIGNLQYYFSRKDDLIKALLDKIIQTHLDTFEALRQDVGQNPEEQFIVIIHRVINDLKKKKTTHFFPELWALANHKPHVSELMDEMYGRYRKILEEIIKEINPQLTQKQIRKLALFITSSLEGHTVFIGFEKPWSKDSKDIITLASTSFLALIKNPPI